MKQYKDESKINFLIKKRIQNYLIAEFSNSNIHSGFLLIKNWRYSNKPIQFVFIITNIVILIYKKYKLKNKSNRKPKVRIGDFRRPWIFYLNWSNNGFQPITQSISWIFGQWNPVQRFVEIIAKISIICRKVNMILFKNFIVECDGGFQITIAWNA